MVVSDNPKAYALKRALSASIPTMFMDPRRFTSREAFDRSLSRIVEAAGARLIVLAGFMRILSPWFIRRYPRRILNIHPALLPAFSGTQGIQDALHYGVKVTGVTVHFVDEKVDHGPIILQVPMPVRYGDTQESLTSRIHRLEHRVYPKAIQWVLEGRVKVEGRKVQIK